MNQLCWPAGNVERLHIHIKALVKSKPTTPREYFWGANTPISGHNATDNFISFDVQIFQNETNYHPGNSQ